MTTTFRLWVLFLLGAGPLLIFGEVWGTDRQGHLGLGMTTQIKHSFPSVSFKIQRTKSFAFGGFLGHSSHEEYGGNTVGIKFYRNFFNEPQLNFYGGIMMALLQTTEGEKKESGFQVDFTLGSEFHFTGLKSLGFSFEFGLSLHKLNDFVVETAGEKTVVSAIHFYL